MFRRSPDWLIYGVIAALIYLNAVRSSHENDVPQATLPAEIGPILPSESPQDPYIMIELEDKRVRSGIGTAFSIDKKGTWMTARHVVDGCDSVILVMDADRGVRVKVETSTQADIATMKSKWIRNPIPSDLNSDRRIGERGYFFGFPQGRPGEVVGSLLGRRTTITRGRYNMEETTLAWTELGRSRSLKGSLGGLSGSPVLDRDGEVIGVASAEGRRRGRVYTVAPKNLREFVGPIDGVKPIPITANNYGIDADRYRRNRQIAHVVCLVK